MARGVELLVAAAGLMLVVSVPLVTAQLPAFVANAICAPGSTDCTSCLNLRTATLGTLPEGYSCIWCNSPSSGLNCQATNNFMPNSCPNLNYELFTCSISVLTVVILNAVGIFLLVACCCFCCVVVVAALTGCARSRRQRVTYERVAVV